MHVRFYYRSYKCCPILCKHRKLMRFCHCRTFDFCRHFLLKLLLDFFFFFGLNKVYTFLVLFLFLIKMVFFFFSTFSLFKVNFLNWSEAFATGIQSLRIFWVYTLWNKGMKEFSKCWIRLSHFPMYKYYLCSDIKIWTSMSWNLIFFL